MGLTISSLFSRLFGKKQMRILMGEPFPASCSLANGSHRGGVSGDAPVQADDFKPCVLSSFFSERKIGFPRGFNDS